MVNVLQNFTGNFVKDKFTLTFKVQKINEGKWTLKSIR